MKCRKRERRIQINEVKLQIAVGYAAIRAILDLLYPSSHAASLCPILDGVLASANNNVQSPDFKQKLTSVKVLRSVLRERPKPITKAMIGYLGCTKS